MYSANKNAMSTSYDSRTGDGENYTRPEQYDDNVQYTKITGDCEDYTRPEKYDDYVPRNPCTMVHNTALERQWIDGNSLLKNPALKPCRKTAGIALRLQQIEEERAIQRREIETERRALASQRKALEEKYKLLEQLLSTKREKHHYHVSRRSKQERSNISFEHTPKDDTNEATFKNTSVGNQDHNQCIDQNVSKENEQNDGSHTKHESNDSSIMSEMILAWIEPSPHNFQSNKGTQQLPTSAISKTSPSLCKDSKDPMNDIIVDSISYVYPVLSTTVPVSMIGASIERPANRYGIGLGRQNCTAKLYRNVFSHTLSSEKRSRYDPRALMSTRSDYVIRKCLCSAASFSAVPEKPTVWLIFICAFVSTTAASCYSVLDHFSNYNGIRKISSSILIHSNVIMNDTIPSKTISRLRYGSLNVPVMLQYSSLELSMGIMRFPTQPWQQIQLVRTKLSENTLGRLLECRGNVKYAVIPSVVDGVRYLQCKDRIPTKNNIRQVGSPMMREVKVTTKQDKNPEKADRKNKDEKTSVVRPVRGKTDETFQTIEKTTNKEDETESLVAKPFEYEDFAMLARPQELNRYSVQSPGTCTTSLRSLPTLSIHLHRVISDRLGMRHIMNLQFTHHDDLQMLVPCLSCEQSATTQSIFDVPYVKKTVNSLERTRPNLGEFFGIVANPIIVLGNYFPRVRPRSRTLVAKCLGEENLVTGRGVEMDLQTAVPRDFKQDCANRNEIVGNNTPWEQLEINTSRKNFEKKSVSDEAMLRIWKANITRESTIKDGDLASVTDWIYTIDARQLQPSSAKVMESSAALKEAVTKPSTLPTKMEHSVVHNNLHDHGSLNRGTSGYRRNISDRNYKEHDGHEQSEFWVGTRRVDNNLVDSVILDRPACRPGNQRSQFRNNSKSLTAAALKKGL